MSISVTLIWSLIGFLSFNRSSCLPVPLPPPCFNISTNVPANYWYLQQHQQETEKTKTFYWRCSAKRCSNFSKFTKKPIPESLFDAIKCSEFFLLKKVMQHRCFPVKFGKIFRISNFKNTSLGQLLLAQHHSSHFDVKFTLM